MATIKRVVGAVGDVRELEYIAALHQTCAPQTRENGTIGSLDVQRYLISRHGIYISHETAVDIVRGLGGGISQEELVKDEALNKKKLALLSRLQKKDSPSSNMENFGNEEMPSPAEEEEQDPPRPVARDDLDVPEEYLDLVQILALILIPTLVKAAQNSATSPTTSNTTPATEDIRPDAARSLDPQPPHLIKDVLHMLLLDIFGNEVGDDYPVLDADFVRNILLQVGENERAENPDLIQAMVLATSSSPKVASLSQNGELGRLDVDAFARALTSDVQTFSIESDNRTSTFFQDVFGGSQINQPVASDDQITNDEETNAKTDRALDFTMQDHNNVDFTVDTHSSLLVVLLIWLFFVLAALAYASLFNSLINTDCTAQSDQISCLLVSTIITWTIIAVVLSLGSLVVMIPLSVANNPSVRTPGRFAIGFFFCALYTLLPFLIVKDYEKNITEPYNRSEATVNSEFYIPVLYGTLGTGCLLCFVFLVNFFISLLVARGQPSSGGGLIGRWMNTSSEVGESRLKRAATRKINMMLMNAHVLHAGHNADNGASKSFSKSTKSASDHAMLNYVLRGQHVEDQGGFFWTWKLYLTGDLFDVEGIWIPTRIWVFQTAQAVVGTIIAWFLFYATLTAIKSADEARSNLEPGLPKWVHDLVPTKKDVQVALYPAWACALGAMVLLFIIYLPSTVAAILQYRCGDRPSLGSRYFIINRKNADQAYTNTGNAMFGLLTTGVLTYAIVGLVIFLYIWTFSKQLMVTLTAWGIGITVTVVIKMLLTMTCRSSFYKVYYRTKPRHANLANLALEGWYIGLGGGVILGRLIQFFCAAVFWVGRIDVTFLSADVSIFGYAFDYVPLNFIKELLSHEAHRHPYLERLGQMYLFEIKDKDFCSEAGAVWRQVFVQILMPWMRKYRVFNEARTLQAIASSSMRRKEVEEEAKTFNEIMGENLEDVQAKVAANVSETASATNTTVAGVVSSADKTVSGVVSSADRTVSGVVSSADKTVAGVVSSADKTVSALLRQDNN